MLVVSLAIAGWSANAAIKALFEAMNVMWGKTDTRSVVRQNLESLAFTFVGIIIVMLVLVAMTDIPAYISILAIDPWLKSLFGFIRWPIVYCAGLLGIVMLYRRGPCRPAPRVIWTLPGAVMASIVWIGASLLFSWYVSTLARYTATYGSLAAVVVTMTWLWLSAVILLAGAELSAQIERQIDHGDERLTGVMAILQAVERHYSRERPI
jgi:membrane protein